MLGCLITLRIDGARVWIIKVGDGCDFGYCTLLDVIVPLLRLWSVLSYGCKVVFVNLFPYIKVFPIIPTLHTIAGICTRQHLQIYTRALYTRIYSKTRQGPMLQELKCRFRSERALI